MRTVLKLAGPFFTLAGIPHFLSPKTYEPIMPPWLPAHRELIYASGAAEIATGVALMHPDPAVRRAGGYFGALTLLAVLPANVYMAANAERFSWVPGGRATLRARIPLQGLLVAWCLAAGRR